MTNWGNESADVGLNMVDKQKLHDELVEAFIGYQWRLDNPYPAPDESMQTMVDKYLHNSMFHAKVDQIVYGVMTIVDKHI